MLSGGSCILITSLKGLLVRKLVKRDGRLRGRATQREQLLNFIAEVDGQARQRLSSRNEVLDSMSASVTDAYLRESNGAMDVHAGNVSKERLQLESGEQYRMSQKSAVPASKEEIKMSVWWSVDGRVWNGRMFVKS
ncbi:hypothetical protein E2P81_ATG04933 [Venturia nashicola]|nr:hypothetical protein E2P81_ATG04933 [Venturia nashicola]